MTDYLELLSIAFVSGKGGVGKTMLAVAAGAELSSKDRTLLIDLDFFNRGLTGLMTNGEYLCDIDKPCFFNSDNETNTQWVITNVGDNLFHISYPDLTAEELTRLETVDFQQLQSDLREFIIKACKKADCKSVVLDCHGGPDHSSFAACLISHYSILVSEPDKITFYGTLHFVRQLNQISEGADYDLRLVFNKVLPVFSPFFLRSLYNREMKKIFASKALLGMFPLEVYLSKEFERTPLLTKAFPNSLLARKTSVLLFDLLDSSAPDRLSAATRALPRWVSWVRRWTLGKPNPLLDLNFILVITAILYLFSNAMVDILSKRMAPALSTNVLRMELLLVRAEDPNFYVVQNSTIQKFLKQEDMLASKISLDLHYTDPGRENPRSILYSGEDITKRLGRIGPESYPIRMKLVDASNLKTRRKLLLELANRISPTKLADQGERVHERLAALSTWEVEWLTLYEKIGSWQALGVWSLCWLLTALLVFLSRAVDRSFTYASRVLSRSRSIAWCLIGLTLWTLPALAISSWRNDDWDWDSSTIVLFGGISLVFVCAALTQIFRVYRELRYEKRYFESTLRVVGIVVTLLLMFATGDVF
jgi:cellulose biosynthesis protein BcsQ